MSSFLRNLKFPKILLSGGKERRGGEDRERRMEGGRERGNKKTIFLPTHKILST